MKQQNERSKGGVFEVASVIVIVLIIAAVTLRGIRLLIALLVSAALARVSRLLKAFFLKCQRLDSSLARFCRS